MGELDEVTAQLDELLFPATMSPTIAPPTPSTLKDDSPSSQEKLLRNVQIVIDDDDSVDSLGTEDEQPAAKRMRLMHKQPPPRLYERRSLVMSRKCGILPSEFRCLKRLRAPLMLFVILEGLVRLTGSAVARDLHGVEYFAGVANIQKTMMKRGWQCLGYDKLQDKVGQDLNTDAGFMAAIAWAMRIQLGGLAHREQFAPVGYGSHARKR